MEDSKNTILAVVLCLAVLVGWSFLSDKMGWTPKAPESVKTEQADVPASAAPKPVSVVPAPKFTPSAGREVVVETPLYRAVIYSGGGVLRSFQLKRYHETTDPQSPLVNMVSPAAATTAPMGMVVNGRPSWSVGSWQYDGGNIALSEGETANMTLVGEVDGVRIVRMLTFDADTYLIKEQTRLRSADGTARTARLNITAAATRFEEGGSNYDPMRVAWYDTSYHNETDEKDLTKQGMLEKGDFRWAGLMNNYFMNTVIPVDPVPTLKGRVEGGVWRVGLEKDGILLTDIGTPCDMYWWFGPKDRLLLDKAPNHLSEAIDYGMFSWIAKPLLTVLEFFQRYVGNWGVAILILTVCIKIVFWPLAQKSYRSMEKMKQVQPLMKQIQEKYKDDKAAMNREVMQLYKTYGVNPMSGCLPMLVQIPVFIGLYQALLNALQLRHACFIEHLPGTDLVWLADLSAKDPYYITPLVMGATMFIQQKMMPPAGDPKQQRIMMFMPLIFLFMFLNFPSGLVVYWLCNNVLSIAQQWWLLRRIRVPAPRVRNTDKQA